MARSLLTGSIVVAVLVALGAACAVEDSAPPPPLRRAQATTRGVLVPDAGSDGASASSAPTTLETAPLAPSGDAGAAAAPVEVEVDLASLELEVVANGWGPIEKNTSNGEIDPNDGKPISLDGVVYAKGLGVHADSEVNVALDGKYKAFLADVGVDDEVGTAGSVELKVIADGETLFESGVMTGTTTMKKVNVDVTGRKQLKLVVTNGGDDNGSDHADWAGARLVK